MPVAAAALLTVLAAGLAALAPASSTARQGGGPTSEENAAVQYLAAAPAADPVARLQKRLDSGQVKLIYDSKSGYLRSVLRELGISPASQMLVFSKTSLQRDHISPRTPRAIYYNDACYIGWVQNGGLLEISAVDPRHGAIFYTLRQQKTARPRFARQTYDCLQCHSSPTTGNVPGHLVRSVFTRIDGNPEFSAGSFVTTQESKMSERWGGWYVTGRHGKQRHMGNVVARGGGGGNGEEVTLDREAGANVVNLERFVDTAPYLTRHSDIAALLVLEHQTLVHNLITKLNYQTRDALRDERQMNLFEKADPDQRRPSTLSRIKSVGEPLVEALLFAREEPLTEPVAGTARFAQEFAAGGRRDTKGRSLRDLDLKTRLLRYPCSYLVYSEAFDDLPEPAKAYVYGRFHDILTGKDTGKEFAHLSDMDRRVLLEILRETKPDFAARYRREENKAQ